MKNIRVASVQMEHLAGDKAANLRKIEAFVERAASSRVQLIALPESCITGYWFLRKLFREQLIALAEPIPDGPSTARLRSLSARYGMTIGAGLLELGDDGRLYNSYVVVMPDGGVRRHRKIQAFENEHISPGSEYTVFDTPHGVRIGVLICYDNNIIENARITALMGAEVILAPHQTGGCDSRSPHAMKPVDRRLWDRRHADPAEIEAELVGPKGKGWIMRWLPSRAHDNGVFYVFANGIGIDDDEVRTGNAMILDCYGRTIAETNRAGDDMVWGDLDSSLLADCTGQRWLSARRPLMYAPLAAPTGREREMREVRFGRNGIEIAGQNPLLKKDLQPDGPGENA